MVANRIDGTVSVIDPKAPAVVSEVLVGGLLVDLSVSPDDSSLLVVDQAAGQLVRLSFENGSLGVTERLAVGVSPVEVRVSPDGTFCSVSLLWPHRIALVELGRRRMGLRKTVDLPFAPRKQWIDPAGRLLIVADGFGGNVAAVDLPSGEVRAVRSIPANNIGGLAGSANGTELLVSHPMLDQRLADARENIVWGSVVGDVLRSVRVDHLCEPPPPAAADRKAELQPVPIGHWSLYPLGENGRGAGDPGEVLVTPDGQTAVCLGGVNEVAVRASDTDPFRRFAVGRRPVALAFDPAAHRLYVANEFDDSVSVLDLSEAGDPRVVGTISLGPTRPPTQAERGEELFYDARLSLDGWFSCHTCHTDGHACGLVNDNHTDGSFGTPKRILSLLGTNDTGPWAWFGHMSSLEEQARTSITSTMQGKPQQASDENAGALAEYLRTLAAPPSATVARGTVDRAAAARGRRVFEESGCSRCHIPPDYTSPRTADVGLADEAGHTHFNPPSLRGLTQRPAYFHDNRATSLREVLTKYKHPDGDEVDPAELEDLLRFLESL